MAVEYKWPNYPDLSGWKCQNLEEIPLFTAERWALIGIPARLTASNYNNIKAVTPIDKLAWSNIKETSQLGPYSSANVIVFTIICSDAIFPSLSICPCLILLAILIG